MPGVSDIELVRTLNDCGIAPVVIVITAHDEPSVRNEERRMGVCYYLPKPFHGRKLLDAVNLAVQPVNDRENSIEI